MLASMSLHSAPWLCALALAACGPMVGPTPAATPAPSEAAATSPGPPGGGPAGGDPWRATKPDATGAGTATPRPPEAKASGSKAPTSTAQRIVDAHNAYRAKHCAPALAWSEALAAYAAKWAATLRDRGCAFEHSRGKYGENLAAGTSGVLDPEAVVAMWYDEVKGYSFKQPGFSMQTGHFTQVVWTTTKRVGCAMTQCKGLDVWVCEYDPPGNWERQYSKHVLPSSCQR